ncbi:MAG: hypothetical protein ACRDGN_08580, partial [bacterium]
TALDAAMVVAERLRTEIGSASPPPEAGGVGGEGLAASIGVAAYPTHGATSRDLHRKARAARDQARLMGGNMVNEAAV